MIMEKDKDIKLEIEEGSFNDELTTDEKHVRQLVQMNHRRGTAHKPDVDQAWKEFHDAKMKPRRSSRKFSLWHLSAAVLTGAAAMLAVVLVFQNRFSFETEEASDFVALQYDKAPQCIKLEQEGKTLDLTANDSVSFCPSTVSKSIAQSQPAEVKTQRLSTPRGMDFKVILPDGSEVWLNAESTIEFPTSFQSGSRQVNLQGEAYFKVAHNEHAPFIVHSNQMNVRVLGTEFNFKTYASEPAHVTLIQGKVEVMRSGDDEAEIQLKPGEDAWFDDKGNLQVEAVDTYAAVQWVKGFFYFHDQPLIDVLRELGRWYNMGVIFKNSEAMHYNVHFSALRNESINVAIESLNRLGRIQIRIEDNDLVVY